MRRLIKCFRKSDGFSGRLAIRNLIDYHGFLSQGISMFDPYHKWLGIPPEHRPPTHYQLLHLSPAEKDPEVIEEAAIRQTTHLRTYQLGPHSDLCTKLLNEVALARKTLLTPALRGKYDAELALKNAPAAAVATPAADFRSTDDEYVRERPPAPKRARSREAAGPKIAKDRPSKLPLWIGLGAGAAVSLILVAVLAAAFLGRADDPDARKKKPPIVVAEKKILKDPINPVRDPVEKKNPVVVPAIVPNPAKGRTVDLIALFDPAEVVKGEGKWNVVNGRLECTDMHLLPRTHFPYKPPAEFDYTVKFSQLKPRNGVNMIMPNSLGKSFYWNVATMRPDGVYWTLASSIDGNSNRYARFDTFRAGEPCTATIEVRKTGVRCFIDGKFAGEHQDLATMSIDSWRQMRKPDLISLCCDDPTTFYEVKVTEVGDRKDDPVVPKIGVEKKDPVVVPAIPGKGRTIDLFTLYDPRDVVHGDWRVDKGRLECASGGGVPRLHFPYKPPAEYDYTVRFTQLKPRNGVSLIMPNGDGGAFFWNPCIVNAAGAFWKLATSPGLGKIDTFRAGEPCTTTVEVRKGGVRCFVDGNLMTETKDIASLKLDIWRKMRDPTVLSLGCDDPTTFLEVRVSEIGEPGMLTREQK